MGGLEFREVAPVLVTTDLGASLARYELLGFQVSAYTDPDGGTGHYGYARRGAVYLHVACVSDLDPLATTVSVYLYVSDADALHAEWRAAGVEGRLTRPQDTPYGLREGAYVDPDGNLLRFGSPMARPA